jgi:hypothetical protein
MWVTGYAAAGSTHRVAEGFELAHEVACASLGIGVAGEVLGGLTHPDPGHRQQPDQRGERSPPLGARRLLERVDRGLNCGEEM